MSIKLVMEFDTWEAARAFHESYNNGVASFVAKSFGAAPVNTPAPSLNGGGEVDTSGAPWHADFHASTKTKTNKGFWKARKGRDEALSNAYHAQYATAPQPAAAPVTLAPQPGIPVTAFPVVANGGAAFAFTPPAITPVPCTMPEILHMANHLLANNAIDNAGIVSISSKYGVSNPNDLATNDAARASVYAEFMQISRASAMKVG